MRIHNYYSDLLLSVRTMFDKHVFGNDTIKSYDFNIANRSFAVDKDYKTSFEFPACIVTLNDDHYIFGERPNVIQQFGPENQMQHIALYNDENRRTIVLQEEHVQSSISIIINCESQLQAKDVEFMVKRYLPLNKYIQFLEYTSFLEIPYSHLETLGIKNGGHKIVNLFTKLNENKGHVEYCYSMSYKPHIRLESISTSIADASTRSFPVNMEVNFLTQMPMYLFDSREPGITEAINIHFSRFGHEPIVDYPIQKLFNIFRETNLEGDLGSPIPKNPTNNGTWIVNDNNSLVWRDKYSGFQYEVAGKPIDGDWDIENGIPIWRRLSDGVKYYVDAEHGNIRKGSITGPIYLKKTQRTYLFDKPKTFIKRTYIVYDSKDISPQIAQDRVIFCVQFDIRDFEIKRGFRYNFIATNGDVFRDYPYLSFDKQENKVCFEVTKGQWNNYFNPSLIHPLMIQFVEEESTKQSCARI